MEESTHRQATTRLGQHVVTDIHWPNTLSLSFRQLKRNDDDDDDDTAKRLLLTLGLVEHNLSGLQDEIRVVGELRVFVLFRHDDER